MITLNMGHFEILRSKINLRLEEIGTKHARRQIQDFPWLYGALGQVPSDVMLICENPSLRGVERADVRPIGGSVAGIEDQWAGNVRGDCIKRFRPALCQLGLKTTGPLQLGGWRCYITNVIKEAAVVREFNVRNKKVLAIEWSPVLDWEIKEVSPSILFTVGHSATKLVKALQRDKLLPSIRTHKVVHYADRDYDHVVKSKLVTEIGTGLSRILS